MPRLSKEHLELTQRKILRFLLERPDTKAKLGVMMKLTEGLCKTKGNSVRRINYKKQIENAHKVLCVESTDLVEWKAKFYKEKKRCLQLSEKNSILSDHMIFFKELKKENEGLKLLLAKYKEEENVVTDDD